MSHVGAKRSSDRGDDLVERAQVDVARGARRHRDVQRRAAPAPAPVSSTTTVPGVQRPLVIADEQHARIVVEHGLRAVAVVGVVVEDHDPLALVGQRGGDDRDVGDQAEPHRLDGGGVMAGRAHGAERGVALGRRAAPRSPSGRRRRRGVAASKLPGLRTCRDRVDRRRAAQIASIRSRYQAGCTRSRSAAFGGQRLERQKWRRRRRRDAPLRAPRRAAPGARDGAGRRDVRGTPDEWRTARSRRWTLPPCGRVGATVSPREASDAVTDSAPLILRAGGVVARVRPWAFEANVAHLVLYNQSRLPTPSDIIGVDQRAAHRRLRHRPHRCRGRPGRALDSNVSASKPFRAWCCSKTGTSLRDQYRISQEPPAP